VEIVMWCGPRVMDPETTHAMTFLLDHHPSTIGSPPFGSMEAGDALREEEERAGIASLLVCAANDQENRWERRQRPRAGTNAASVASVHGSLKLLQLPKHPHVLDGRSSTDRGGNESERDAAEPPIQDEVSQTRGAARQRPGRSDTRLSPVAPLRFEHDVNAAHLKLLGTKRNLSKQLPLKIRQYVYEPAPKPTKPEDRAVSNSNTIDVAVTRAAAVQTTSAVDDKVVQTSCSISPLLPSPSRVLSCSPTDCIGVKVATDTLVGDRPVKKEDRAIGVQCQLREPAVSARAVPIGIADRFPIWIDLKTNLDGSSSSAQPNRYLQVATFTGSPIDTDASHLIIPRSPIPIVREEDFGSIGPDEDDIHPVETEAAKALYEIQQNNAAQAATAAYRERYRLHYASSVVKAGKQTPTEGVQALVEVQNDMEQMKQRLRELEELADSMDYDFKLSYQVRCGCQDPGLVPFVLINDWVVRDVDYWR
jgi:hypothetical protein